MDDQLKALSSSERMVMRVIWERGPSNVRQVLDVQSSRGRAWAYTTAKTVLDRLEAKGYLRRDRTDLAHVYHPTVTPEEFAQRGVTALRETLRPGSVAPLVRALIDSGLKHEEIAELRTWLDALALEEEQ